MDIFTKNVTLIDLLNYICSFVMNVVLKDTVWSFSEFIKVLNTPLKSAPMQLFVWQALAILFIEIALARIILNRFMFGLLEKVEWFTLNTVYSVILLVFFLMLDEAQDV